MNSPPLISEDKITSPLKPIGFTNGIFFRFQRLLAFIFLKTFCRFQVHGVEPLLDGPLIVAANHVSLIDPVVLQTALRQRVHFLMTSDYYFKFGMNRWSRIMRCIPVMEGRFNREAIRSALEVLAAGRTVAIFPQGGLRSTGDFETDMRGIGLLILRSGAPVLPMRIQGTGIVMPRGARFIHPASVKVYLGPFFRVEEMKSASTASRHELLKEITDSVMASIAEL